MSSNWFTKKLGDPQQARPTPAQQPVAPQPQQSRPQQPQAPQQPPSAPPGQITAGEAVASFKGKEAQRIETDTCPNCGSVNYMSRAYSYGQNGHLGKANWVTTDHGSFRPSAQCFDCNYTEDQRFDLMGLDSDGIIG